MRLAAAPRWAISFADLALLLLGCFVMLHAMTPRVAAPGVAAAVDAAIVAELPADALFEPGEARFTEAGAARLRTLAKAQAGRPLQLVSRGGTEAGPRLDAFELAAARAAAVARNLRIDGRYVAIESTDGTGSASAQAMSLRRRNSSTP